MKAAAETFNERQKDAAAGALTRQREANARTAQFAADKTTGEIPDGVKGPEGSTAPVTTEAATKTAEELLGAVAIDEDTPVTKRPEPKPEPAPVAAPVAAPVPQAAAASERRSGRPNFREMDCSVCGKNLGDQNPDYIKLSRIKFKRDMCQMCYIDARTNA